MSFKCNILGGTLLDRQTAKDLDATEAKGYELMQFKYDGIWGCYDGEHTISRNGLVKEILSVPKFPSGTLVAGEFMFGSQWAQNPERIGKLFCFDLLALNGEDLRDKPYQLRYAALKDLLHIISHPRLCVVHSYSTTGNIDRTLAALEKNRSFEGIVVRNWDQPYSADIGRIKLSLTDDFVITNILEGDKKNVGRMGSVEVSQYVGSDLLHIMDVGGGWSDEQREVMWKRPQDFMRKVIEVSGKARFESGAFRHPNFERFRQDKSPSECRYIKPASAAAE